MARTRGGGGKQSVCCLPGAQNSAYNSSAGLRTLTRASVCFARCPAPLQHMMPLSESLGLIQGRWRASCGPVKRALVQPPLCQVQQTSPHRSTGATVAKFHLLAFPGVSSTSTHSRTRSFASTRSRKCSSSSPSGMAASPCDVAIAGRCRGAGRL